MHSRFIRLMLSVLVALCWFLSAPSPPVGAAPMAYVVTTTHDDASDANCTVASCTLRQAVNASNAHDPGTGGTNTITFAPSMTGTITLRAGTGFGTLDLTQGVAITGPGASVLTISGVGAVRIFFVNPPGSSPTVALRSLTIAQGVAPITQDATSDVGGGVFVLGGTLRIDDCVFFANTTDSMGSGGAIFSYLAGVTVRDSTFLLNAAHTGGALYNFQGDMDVVNSTFSRNSADTGAGVAKVSGSVTLISSTLTTNTATGTGGTIAGIVAGNAISVTSSIVAGNPGGDFNDAMFYGDGGGNVIGGDPLLDLLQVNAPGTTETYALLPGSPAIDTGSCPVDPITAATLATDQRGVVRPQGASCDAGAFESRGFTFLNAGGSPQSANVGTAYANPLTVTVASNAGEPVDGGVVTFTAPTSGAGATFDTGGGCVVTQAGSIAVCTIGNGVATAPALSANGAAGQFEVVATARGVAIATHFLLGNRPVASGIMPGSGSITGDGAATITGTGFGAASNRVRVVFDGTTDATVLSVTDTAITLRMPPHAAASVPVTVIVDGVGGVGALTYTYGVVAPLPIAQPSAPPVGSPAPVPAPRPTNSPSGYPNPLPSSRP